MISIFENDEQHQKTLDLTGHWGLRGAGCIVYTQNTKKYLIVKRSAEVLEPFTWGTIGGAIDSDEDPMTASIRELREETGFNKTILKTYLLYVYKKPNFKYYNYIHVVKDEFVPTLNWENIDFIWLSRKELVENLKNLKFHYGLNSAINNGKLLESSDLQKNVENFEHKILSQYQNIVFDIYYDKLKNAIKVNNIIIPKTDRNKGLGSKILTDLNKFADDNDLIVYLTPASKDSYHGTTSKNRLVSFYKKLGFTENKGKKTDYSFFGGMIRRPN